MPEETTHTTPRQNDDDNLPLHTCACGEQHRHRPGGSRSHRDECTSEKKFGDSCCCGPNAGSGNQHRCGHGPRCQ